jgi:hypothetical protein
MRSAAAVRVAGSADDGVGSVISIHICDSGYLYTEIARQRSCDASSRTVSEARDTSLREQVPERRGDDGSVGVGTSSLNVPERLGEQDISQPPRSLVRSGRSAVRIVSIALALTAAIIVLQHLGFPTGSRKASDHASKNVTSPQGLTTGTEATGTPQRTAKLMVQSSPAVVGEPAPLGVTLWGAANDAVVVLKGLAAWDGIVVRPCSCRWRLAAVNAEKTIYAVLLTSAADVSRP